MLKNDAPDYAKSMFRCYELTLLELSTEDNSGTVYFDLFTQDTWIQPPETATLPTSTVEN